jgi:hypothetical protein
MARFAHIQGIMETTTTNTVPNLDAMPESELMAFWSRYHRPTRKDAAALVGKRKGYIGLAQTLANYAVNKATAMTCRLRGDINAAQVYEHACDLCYDRLPEDLRW